MRTFKSANIHFVELISFKSFFAVKYQASTLSESNHFLVGLPCKSACENLDALSARFAI